MKIKYFFLFIFFSILSFGAMSQTPVDNLMMNKGRICFAGIYTHDSWNQYWEGKLKRDNGNIGTLTRQTFMPMFSLGLTNKINLLAALPYVTAAPSAGQFIDQKGLQDIGLWLKTTLLNKTMGPGSFQVHGVIGFSTPAWNYNKDYQPFSLGLGAKEGSLRAIAHYQLNNGLFFRALGSYHLRSNITIERDFYYTDKPIYSNIVDMPDAIMFGFNLGGWWLNNTLNVYASYDGMVSLSGHDIRRQDMPFPSNKMNFSRAGLNIQYYFPFLKQMSVVISAMQVLDGRNFGQSSIYSGGLTYQFGIWNKSSN
ncbi:MAG: transporter [Saprospiraceae bacterium]|nr:transporter [Saprospiraceae bacterium]